MSWKNELKSTVNVFSEWHYNTKTIKLVVRLEESNAERLKIKAD